MRYVDGRNAVKAICILLILGFAGGCGSVQTDSLETQESIDDRTNIEEIQEEEVRENEEYSELDLINDYKNSCQPALFEYNNLLRYEDNYKGNDYYLTVEVAQVLEDGSIRAYFGDGYDDILLEDMRTYDTVKILPNDQITAYAEYSGTTRVVRASNNVEEDIPCFTMYAADIAGVTDVEYYGVDVNNLNYYELYSEFVLEANAMFGMSSYVLYDLNNDGRKELILGYGDCEADFYSEVYTVDEIGAVSSIGGFYGDLSYYVAEDGDGLYGVYGHMGVETVYRVHMWNGEVSCFELWTSEVDEYYENENYIECAYDDDMSLLEQN